MSWRNLYVRKTAIVTISLPMDLLLYVEDLAIKNSWKRSTTIAYLIHMGKVYLDMLETQEKFKERIAKRETT